MASIASFFACKGTFRMVQFGYLKGKEMYIADFLSKASIEAKKVDLDTLLYEVFQVDESKMSDR